MRLYVNKKEIPILKQALIMARCHDISDEDEQRCFSLLERIELCERYQENVEKSVETVK